MDFDERPDKITLRSNASRQLTREVDEDLQSVHVKQDVKIGNVLCQTFKTSIKCLGNMYNTLVLYIMYKLYILPISILTLV